MIEKDKIQITKSSGQQEAFDEVKLIKSLVRAQVPAELAAQVAAEVKSGLSNEVKSSEIHRRCLELLQKHNLPSTARYNLKEALQQLGPSGYPFEKFIGALMQRQGFEVLLNQIVLGFCVEHEVDIIAKKDQKDFMVEVKFHNFPGTKTDLKTALYVQARFEDIKKKWDNNPKHTQKLSGAWLVTNTKFTSEAIAYGNCVGLKLLGWNYPVNGSLQQFIENAGLHPLTCLTSLSDTQKKHLLQSGLVLCQDIEHAEAFSELGLAQSQQEKIVNEIQGVCKI